MSKAMSYFALFPASLALCGMLSITACEMTGEIVNEDDTVTQNAETGTRWMPGHYLMYSPSRRHDEAKRIQMSKDNLKQTAFQPGVRGVVMYVDWDRLESSRNIYDTPTMRSIGEMLEELEGTDKGLGLYVRTRNFGTGDPQKAFVPKYVKNDYCVTQYGGYVALPCLWEKATMDRHIALFKEIARRFDGHPNFAIVSTEETTLDGEGYSHKKWMTQLKRYHREVKSSLKKTILSEEMNFIGDDEDLHEMAQQMEEVGGIGYGWPDTVPCRDTQRSETCGYKLSTYDVARQYQGVLPITPKVATYDLLPDDLNAVFAMVAGDDSKSLKANYVLWQQDFSSRRWADRNDGDGQYSGWRSDLLAKLKQENGKINTAVPSSISASPGEGPIDGGPIDEGPIDGDPIDGDTLSSLCEQFGILCD